MNRRIYSQLLVLAVITAGILASFCLAASAAPSQMRIGFMGMTPDEIYKELGEPHYIRVIDYGAGVRYAYFTPDEWARIADMAPLEQGDDVYVRTIGGTTWQYHLSYTPVYLGGRFAPNYKVKNYIVYPEGTATLSQAAAALPEGKLLQTAQASAFIVDGEGGYGPVLVVRVPVENSELTRDFRRFRERDDICFELEIGFPNRITAAALSSDTVISYIALRLGVQQGEEGTPVNLQAYLK